MMLSRFAGSGRRRGCADPMPGVCSGPTGKRIWPPPWRPGTPFQRGPTIAPRAKCEACFAMSRQVAKITAIYLDASLTEVNVVARQTSKPAHHLRVLDDARDAEVVINGADPARDRRPTQSR